MAKNNKLGTPEFFKMLYKVLVSKIGVFSTWEFRDMPGYGRNEEYLNICDALAEVIGAEDGGYVQHQIAFAFPLWEGEVRHWPPQHSRTAILNISYALQSGFIEFKDIPELVAVHSNNNETFVDGHPKISNPDNLPIGIPQ